MVALDPAKRPTFDTALHTSRGTVFPESFYAFFHNYLSAMNELSSPSIFAKGSSSNAIGETVASNEHIPLPNDSDHRIDKIWSEYETVEPYLVSDYGAGTVIDDREQLLAPKAATTNMHDIFPVELFIPNRDSTLQEFPFKGRNAAHEGKSLRSCCAYPLTRSLFNRQPCFTYVISCLR
jgi:phosphoinositide-3-kinase regulatory subunit 4